MSKFDKPQDVTKISSIGGVDKLMPPYGSIPAEFKSTGNAWSRWQADWFYSGLKEIPTAKDGINAKKAMAHLAAIQRSWEPKHEHKAAAVAYLASLWFKTPSEAKATT